MDNLFDRLTKASPKAVGPLLVVRAQVGFVFLLEGALKFISPDKFGVGRFVKIGIPAPDVLAPFVGTVEIVCGLLVLTGLLTRLAAVPLVIDMVVAIATTKAPLLATVGFWATAHEARVDLAMLSSCGVLIAAGSGSWALDTWLGRRRHVKRGGEGKQRLPEMIPAR